VQLARAAVAKSMMWQPGGGEGGGEGGNVVVSQGQTRYTQAHGRREGGGGRKVGRPSTCARHRHRRRNRSAARVVGVEVDRERSHFCNSLH